MGSGAAWQEHNSSDTRCSRPAAVPSAATAVLRFGCCCCWAWPCTRCMAPACIKCILKGDLGKLMLARCSTNSQRRRCCWLEVKRASHAPCRRLSCAQACRAAQDHGHEHHGGATVAAAHGPAGAARGHLCCLVGVCGRPAQCLASIFSDGCDFIDVALTEQAGEPRYPVTRFVPPAQAGATLSPSCTRQKWWCWQGSRGAVWQL